MVDGLRRVLVVTTVGALLGCAGLFGDADGPIPITVTNSDGSVQTITKGQATSIPADFPLPLAPGLEPQASIVSSAGGPTMVTYKLDTREAAGAMVDFYTTWLTEQGIEFEVESTNLGGMKSTSILAERDGDELAISVMDGMGTRMLTLSVTPR